MGEALEVTGLKFPWVPRVRPLCCVVSDRSEQRQQGLIHFTGHVWI
jgi:hypothetical protein